MRNDRIEGKWIDVFERIMVANEIGAEDEVAILSETQSRQLNVHLCELALLRLGAKPFHVVLVPPPNKLPVPLRSTGTCLSIHHNKAAIQALKSSKYIIDLTVEGIIHAPELPDILSGGPRLYVMPSEHPDVLERIPVGHEPQMAAHLDNGFRLLAEGKLMQVTSRHGTDLSVRLTNAHPVALPGYAPPPGTYDVWPGGIVAVVPAPGTVNGTVVWAPGDVNCTFQRYIETPVLLTIENDFIVRIEGDGVDAAMFREYCLNFAEQDAYGTAHLGWCVNHMARWESLALYDKADSLGSDTRVFAGAFLFSSGANSMAGRYSHCHFDIPMRGCTIDVDDVRVVEHGELLPLSHTNRPAKAAT